MAILIALSLLSVLRMALVAFLLKLNLIFLRQDIDLSTNHISLVGGNFGAVVVTMDRYF